jgi:sec-independent protein translocase protein TatA
MPFQELAMSMLPLFPTVGIPELLIILVIVLIFFGVGKLPQIGKALGEGIRGFREGSRGDGDKGDGGRIEKEDDPDRDHSARAKKRPGSADDTR